MRLRSHVRHGEHRPRRFRHNLRSRAFRFNDGFRHGFGGYGGQLRRHIPQPDDGPHRGGRRLRRAGGSGRSGDLRDGGLHHGSGGRLRRYGLRLDDGAHCVNRWLRGNGDLRDNGFRHRLGGRLRHGRRDRFRSNLRLGRRFRRTDQRNGWHGPEIRHVRDRRPFRLFGCHPQCDRSQVRHVRHCPSSWVPSDDWPEFVPAAFCCVWLVDDWAASVADCESTDRFCAS